MATLSVLVFLFEMILTLTFPSVCRDPIGRRERAGFLAIGFRLTFVLLLTIVVHAIMFLILRENIGVESTVESSINRGMLYYSRDTNLKVSIDRLQITWKCCGSKNYTDYFTVPWMDSINVYSEVLKQEPGYEKDTRFLKTTAVPYSCCNVSKPGPCQHDHIFNQKEGHVAASHLPDVYRLGCATVFKERIFDETIIPMGTLINVTMLLQFIVVLLCRYLQTSINIIPELEIFSAKQYFELKVSPGWLLVEPLEVWVEIQRGLAQK